MPSATITSKGQITIPKQIRDRLNLKNGDSIIFELETENRVVMIPSKRKPADVYGILHKEVREAFTVEEMDNGVAEYFQEKYRPK